MKHGGVLEGDMGVLDAHACSHHVDNDMQNMPDMSKFTCRTCLTCRNSHAEHA